MHFAFTNPNFLPLRTGPARVSDEIALAASKKGHTVSVLTSTPGPAVSASGYEVVRLSARSAPRELREWLRAARPDVVIAHEIRNPLTPTILSWARRAGRRAAVMPHGGLTAMQHYPRLLQRLPYRLSDMIRPPVPPDVLVIGACRQEQSEIQRALGPSRRVACFYLGADGHPTTDRAVHVTPRLFMAGNLGDVRDPKWFAEAARNLWAEKLEFQASVAGPLQRQSRFARRPRFDPPHGVEYLGPLSAEALNHRMADSDLFVYPSRYESFGLPVLEAAVHGLPIVTTAHGIANELALDKYGVIASSHEPGALGPALRAALKHINTLRAAAQARRPALAAWAAWRVRAKVYLDWLEHDEVAVPEPPPS